MSLNRASLYGESIFTSFRSVNGAVARLENHLERLFEGVNSYYLEGRLDYDLFLRFFELESLKTKINEHPNHYFRLTFFANKDPFDGTLGLSDLEFDLSIKEVKYVDQGVRLQLAPSPYSEYVGRFKSGSYFPAFEAKANGKRDGFDDVLFCRGHEITEASTSVLILKKATCFYSPTFKGGLTSISLKVFSDFCERNDLTLKRVLVKPQDLSGFDSAFLINSVSLIKPVYLIDEMAYILDRKTLRAYTNYLGLV